MSYRPLGWDKIIAERFPNKEEDMDECQAWSEFESIADEILRELKSGGMPTSPQMPNVLELWTLGWDPSIRSQILIKKPSWVIILEEDNIVR